MRFFLMPRVASDEVPTRGGFFSEDLIVSSLFFGFFYGCALLAGITLLRATEKISILYFCLLPPVLITAHFYLHFRRSVVLSQVFIAALLSLGMIGPALMIIPLLKAGYFMSLRTLFASFSSQFWRVAGSLFIPLIWGFIEAIFLRALLQEGIKYLVSRKLVRSKIGHEPKRIIVYSIAAAAAVAMAEALIEFYGLNLFLNSLSLKFNSNGNESVTYSGEQRLLSNSQILALWISFALYQWGYSFPMQIATGAFTSLQICKIWFLENSRASWKKVLPIPMLIHSVPLCFSVLFRAITQYQARRISSGTSMLRHADAESLTRLATFSFFFQSLNFLIRTVSLFGILILTRYAFLEVNEWMIHRDGNDESNPSPPASIKGINIMDFFGYMREHPKIDSDGVHVDQR